MQLIDKQLRVLERAGLVTSGRGGREVLDTVQQYQLERSAAWLTELARRWDRRLKAIDSLAEAALEKGFPNCIEENE